MTWILSQSCRSAAFCSIKSESYVCCPCAEMQVFWQGPVERPALVASHLPGSRLQMGSMSKCQYYTLGLQIAKSRFSVYTAGSKVGSISLPGAWSSRDRSPNQSLRRFLPERSGRAAYVVRIHRLWRQHHSSAKIITSLVLVTVGNMGGCQNYSPFLGP